VLLLLNIRVLFPIRSIVYILQQSACKTTMAVVATNRFAKEGAHELRATKSLLLSPIYSTATVQTTDKMMRRNLWHKNPTVICSCARPKPFSFILMHFKVDISQVACAVLLCNTIRDGLALIRSSLKDNWRSLAQQQQSVYMCFLVTSELMRFALPSFSRRTWSGNANGYTPLYRSDSITRPATTRLFPQREKKEEKKNKFNSHTERDLLVVVSSTLLFLIHFSRSGTFTHFENDMVNTHKHLNARKHEPTTILYTKHETGTRT